MVTEKETKVPDREAVQGVRHSLRTFSKTALSPCGFTACRSFFDCGAHGAHEDNGANYVHDEHDVHQMHPNQRDTEKNRISFRKTQIFSTVSSYRVANGLKPVLPVCRLQFSFRRNENE